jgi:hypothetical protein
MHSAVRVFAVALLAAVSVTCADQTVSGLKGVRRAQLAIAPVFQRTSEGGPDIEVEKVKGVLKNKNGTDSVLAEARVEGDSAILEFSNVAVTGDSTTYELKVQAFEADNDLVFEGKQDVKVKPGENAPAAPTMEYAASDKVVDELEIKVGSQEITSLQLDWAGAAAGDNTCLNRAPKVPANTQQQLTVVGTADGQPVSEVRVGYRSLDESVATVDQNGLVRARCSNKATQIIVETFLGVQRTIDVNVTAPAFSLLMTPESTTVERGATKQMTAVLVDENNNSTPASQVTWGSSDDTRALVSTSGVVTALRNGRVVITASAGDRSTVGIVQVVRPKAASVRVVPGRDTVGFGQIRQYFARAFDAAGRVIFDATDFEWFSSNTGVVAVHPATGVALAKQTEASATISAKIDGKIGSAAVNVIPELPPGTINGVVKDGSTEAPLPGATITTSSGASATSVTDGSYSIQVKAGENVVFTKTGYATVTFYDAPAFPNKTVQVRPVHLSPGSGNGTMTGKVQNALSGNPVSGMTVKAYSGLNAHPSPKNPDVQPITTATSASDGTFSMSNVPAGAYTFVATGTGYSSGMGVGIALAGTTKDNPAVIMPPMTLGGSFFIVLTWGSCGGGGTAPCDLDAHLTGPQIPDTLSRFQVFFGNKSYIAGGDTIAALDVDKSNGVGPEVIGLRPSAFPGVYRYYVKDVSNSATTGSFALANSAGARVDVFQDNRVIATFFPPTNQAGTLWKVFEFDGARIFPVGVIEEAGNPSVLPLRVAPTDRAADDARRVAGTAKEKSKP